MTYYWNCAACGCTQPIDISRLGPDKCLHCQHIRSGELTMTKEEAGAARLHWRAPHDSRRFAKIETLKRYLLLKVEEGDYHAVSDAANDIRVLEGK